MRTKIIKAAIAAFEKQGISFLLSDVAKSLKISKKTIYQYFSSKDELVSCAIDYIFTDIHRQNEEIRVLELPPMERLSRILATYPTVIDLDEGKMDKLLLVNPEIHHEITRQFESHWELTLDTYAECVQAGAVRPIRPECFRTVMLGVFDSVINQGGGKAEMEECVEAVLYGFAAQGKGGQ